MRPFLIATQVSELVNVGSENILGQVFNGYVDFDMRIFFGASPGSPIGSRAPSSFRGAIIKGIYFIEGSGGLKIAVAGTYSVRQLISYVMAETSSGSPVQFSTQGGLSNITANGVATTVFQFNSVTNYWTNAVDNGAQRIVKMFA